MDLIRTAGTNSDWEFKDSLERTSRTNKVDCEMPWRLLRPVARAGPPSEGPWHAPHWRSGHAIHHGRDGSNAVGAPPAYERGDTGVFWRPRWSMAVPGPQRGGTRSHGHFLEGLCLHFLKVATDRAPAERTPRLIAGKFFPPDPNKTARVLP